MTATSTHEPPTRKQLAYLRSLARATGTTFTLPRTKRQASRQIAAMRQRPVSTQLEFALDDLAVRGGELPEPGLMTDACLVALGGDEADLYARHHRALRRVVARRVRMSADLVDEACQQAWLILLRRQPDRGPALFGWLVTVAVREGYRLSAIDRRELPLNVTAGPDSSPAEQVPAGGALDESLEARRALRALAGLPERQRRFAVLRAAGFSYQEIGEVEGASQRTVHRQLVKASRRLRVAREHAA